MATRHSLLTGTQLHQPFPYEQASDPGAVGAGKFWYDTTNSILKRRNGANTGWINHSGGDVPVIGNVRNGIVYDSGTKTGNITLPTAAQVLSGVGYGSNGTEYTGSLSGGSPTGFGVRLAEGADEGDLRDVYDGFPAGGGIIWLPDHLITLTSTLLFNIKPVRIFGTTVNSGLEINGDVGLSGSTMMIVFLDVANVELAYFKIVHDRVAGGSAMRCLALDVQAGASYINMHHLTGIDITSDFLIVRPWTPSLDEDPTRIPHHIYFDNNHCEEWYESYMNIRTGSGHHIYARGNTGNVSAGHPNGTISRPYGFSLALEDSHGRFEDIEWAFNSLTNTMTSKVNSLGAIMSREGSDPFTNGLAYNRVSIYGNTWTGWWTGMLMRAVHINDTVYPGAHIVTMDNNNFIGTTYRSLDVQDPYGYSSTGDRLFLINNRMDTSAGGAGYVFTEIGAGDLTITDINNTTY